MNPLTTSKRPVAAKDYLLGLIEEASRIVHDGGLADRNVRLAINLFFARREISAHEHQMLLLRAMRERAERSARLDAGTIAPD